MRFSSLRYLIKEGFRSLWQNRFMAIASIGVLVSCLLLTGGAYLVFVNIDSAFDWVYGQNVVVAFAREDCTSLSFADESFDAVTVAFGIRNFEGLDKGLSEMCRVLKTGGHLVILELSTPDRFPMKQLFTIYSKVVIPLLGKCISKDNSAYTYLPESIRAFPQGEVMQEVIRKAGFSEVHFKRLTFGICTLYVATK